jgi:hypothetical protein
VQAVGAQPGGERLVGADQEDEPARPRQRRQPTSDLHRVGPAERPENDAGAPGQPRRRPLGRGRSVRVGEEEERRQGRTAAAGLPRARRAL